VEEMWMSALTSKLSLMIVDENTKKIIGMRAIRVTKKSDHTDVSLIKDESVKKLLEFFEFTSEHSNVFEKYGITEYFEFFGLAVLPEYRQRGIGTVLMQAGVSFLGHLKRPSYLKGSCSSNFSKKIYDKFDFEAVGDYAFEDYKVDGKVVFDNTGEHKSMKLYVMFLQ
jgi:GNAT superfamily N-acetyltransferase